MDLEKYLSHHSKKHIIFDFDLTLVKLDIDWSIPQKKCYVYLSELDKETMSKYTYSTMSYSLFNIFIEKFGPKVKEFINEQYKQAEGKELKAVLPNDPLITFVKNNEKYQYYIWSNNQRKTITSILENLGISDKIKIIVSGDENLLYKPDQAGLQKMFTGDKKDWLYVGDSQNDKQTAQIAGIDFYLDSFFRSIYI